MCIRDRLREVFLDKLYPNNEEDKKNDANDVVRLSSLIDAQFGHNEFDNILEEALPDQLIQPGRLHRLLVQLDVYKRQVYILLWFIIE